METMVTTAEEILVREGIVKEVVAVVMVVEEVMKVFLEKEEFQTMAAII